MPEQYNIYCDESNHLEKSPVNVMVLGAIFCPKNKVAKINERIKEIKIKHGLSPYFEIKWTKVSKAKYDFYQDIVDYFFDINELHFRAIVIYKVTLDHKRFNQSHDEWYYKMYFELLSKILDPEQEYFIYVDIKDTRGQQKVEKLREVLCNNMYDFERKIIKRIQQIRSHEVNLLQLTDLLIGALQYNNRADTKESEAKKNLIERIKKASSYGLDKSTLLKEKKFNLLFWRGDNNV